MFQKRFIIVRVILLIIMLFAVTEAKAGCSFVTGTSDLVQDQKVAKSLADDRLSLKIYGLKSQGWKMATKYLYSCNEKGTEKTLNWECRRVARMCSS